LSLLGDRFHVRTSIADVSVDVDEARGLEGAASDNRHDALKELGLEDRTILWNVVPFHPAGPVPLSNRTPRAAERRAGREWLRRILAITQPDVVAAIGRVAERALRPGTLYLRHPARGGAVRFHHGLAELARERGLV
jgi:uracil-DNA glycosylase